MTDAPAPTAWLLVTRELQLKPDEWVVQSAAGSTVGKVVIQLAKDIGFRTINIVRRRAAVEEIKALGGTEVICSDGGRRGEGIVTRAIIGKLSCAWLVRGAEAIILGCTEVMLLISQNDSSVPVFDTTMLHALAAVDAALS